MTFWKPEICGQAVLPDRSILIGKKKWWKIPIFNCENSSILPFLTILKCKCSSLRSQCWMRLFSRFSSTVTFNGKRRLKIRWLSLFCYLHLVYWFFPLLAEMGKWETEEDDTLAVAPDDDDEVRKNSETRIWLHQYVILYCRTRSAFFFLTMWHLILF